MIEHKDTVTKTSSNNNSQSSKGQVHEMSGLESIEAFQSITKPAESEEDKKLAQELKRKGNEYTIAKDYGKAVEMYSQALKLQGDNEVFWSNRSAAYLMIDGMHTLALRDALVAQKLKKGYVERKFKVRKVFSVKKRKTSSKKKKSKKR